MPISTNVGPDKFTPEELATLINELVDDYCGEDIKLSATIVASVVANRSLSDCFSLRDPNPLVADAAYTMIGVISQAATAKCQSMFNRISVDELAEIQKNYETAVLIHQTGGREDTLN